ncbi:MAG: hypothetical protein MZV70_16265 [Desulfobacterales bacterium]|nr:hypothetical protein [Desulfobacterales bacterium]
MAAYSPLRDSAYAEIENLRLALEWGLENHVETAPHLATNYNIITGWMGNHVRGLAVLKTARGRLLSLYPTPEGESAISATETGSPTQRSHKA